MVIAAAILWVLMALGGMGLDLYYVLTTEIYDHNLVRLEIMFAPGVVASILMLVFAVRTLTRRARDTLGAGITSILFGGVFLVGWVGVSVMSGGPDEVEWALSLAPPRGLLCLLAGIFALVGRNKYRDSR